MPAKDMPHMGKPVLIWERKPATHGMDAATISEVLDGLVATSFDEFCALHAERDRRAELTVVKKVATKRNNITPTND